MSVASKDNKREFHASATPIFNLIFAANFVACLLMLSLGMYYNHVWKYGRGNAFVALAAVWAVCLLYSRARALNRSICFTEKNITFRMGTDEFTCGWRGITRLIPGRGGLLFRCTKLSDGKRTVVFDSASFEDYDKIVRHISDMRDRASGV